MELNCKLCREQKKLKDIHIIPKFFGRWVKQTGATGIIRKVTNPNIPFQDIS